ncbi:hypothetical protein [Sciscionella marina]|nr:hypothetical protein [Sciscionella marina]
MDIEQEVADTAAHIRAVLAVLRELDLGEASPARPQEAGNAGE